MSNPDENLEEHMRRFEERMQQRQGKGSPPAPGEPADEQNVELVGVDRLQIALGLHDEDLSVVIMFNAPVQAIRMTWEQAMQFSQALAEQALASERERTKRMTADIKKTTEKAMRLRGRRGGNGNPRSA